MSDHNVYMSFPERQSRILLQFGTAVSSILILERQSRLVAQFRNDSLGFISIWNGRFDYLPFRTAVYYQFQNDSLDYLQFGTTVSIIYTSERQSRLF